MKEEELIFLISAPRSGSTYVQRILSNNAQVNTVSEPWILLNFMNQFDPTLVHTSVNNRLTHEAFQEYLKKAGPVDYTNAFRSFLLELYTPLKGECRYFLDKTPRYWEIVDEIAEMFPKSKLVVLHRSPLDIAKSMVRTWNLNSLSMINNYRRDLLFAPKKLEEFCKEHQQNPQIRCVQYESLLKNPTEITASLYDWLEIPFHKDSVDIENNKKHLGTFGDPYQNLETNNTDAVKANNEFLETDSFHQFLVGYTHYLGEDYFHRNNFNIPHKTITPTAVFDDFLSQKGLFEFSEYGLEGVLQLRQKNNQLERKINRLKDSNSFKLGSILTAPFRIFRSK
ncbi:sulfotransferase family protein [Altibacter sp. HG106]|uniref:sulfotransferase family protein n=1 Tax=Altibacter sp. HG106 TaxID=3023937 RepID=UPI002350B7CA|nr:sulfotransferase [Altibacter sp. HG106]MDC7995718.1 sulfotransferase [Altibacter sp. HG106]